MPFSSPQRIHLFHFKIDTKGDLMHWYLVRMLRDVTNKLVGFFIPIWLFQIGSHLSWSQLDFLSNPQKGLLTICLYFFLYRLVILMVTLPIVRLFEKYGYHSILFVAQVGQAVMLWLMSQSGVHPQLLLAAVVIDAIQFVAFWSADSHLIANQTLKSRVGEDLGLIQFSLELVALLAPALGGFIIVTLGFEELLWLSLILPVLGALLATQIKAKVLPIEKSTIKQIHSEVKIPWLGVALVGRYLNNAVILLWPLYIFNLLGGADRVGFLFSLSLFISLVVSLLMGFYLDHTRSTRPMLFSGGLLSIIWLTRMMIWQPLHLAIAEVMDRVTANVHWLCFDVVFFKNSRGQRALWFFAYREIVLSVVAMIFWSGLGLFFWLYEDPWQALFLVAAVGVMASVLIRQAWQKPVQ